jgi:hypothetical protein
VPRYFLDLPEDTAPRPWEPREGPRPERADTRYFGAVFLEMEARLEDPDVDVYLTWDTERLPAYGARVVAVVLGDEGGRIPRYTGGVRAVFKCYGTRPPPPAAPLRRPSLLGLGELAQWGLRWMRWVPGAAAHTRVRAGRRLRGRPAPPDIAVIPLGTYNQVELPVLPIAQRPTDVFFAGSVEHSPSPAHRLGSPKTRARREMLAAAARIGLHRPGLRFDLRLTPGFNASAAGSAETYSRALMDARACLAPRGTSVETFRVFEGLRAGCVVVVERLPRHWFYGGAPLLQVERWNDLERVLLPVLDSPVELERRHAAALEWWRTRCSPAAVGSFLADRLNAR